MFGLTFTPLTLGGCVRNPCFLFVVSECDIFILCSCVYFISFSFIFPGFRTISHTVTFVRRSLIGNFFLFHFSFRSLVHFSGRNFVSSGFSFYWVCVGSDVTDVLKYFTFEII